MKKCNINIWNYRLAEQNWEALCETEDVDIMATTLSKNVNAALDICAPVKTFKIRPAKKECNAFTSSSDVFAKIGQAVWAILT